MSDKCYMPLSWGAKVSDPFRRRIRLLADDLDMPIEGPSWLLACIAWESGETFSPSIKNGAGSGATGLIQFMPTTAKGLGTSVEQLACMSAVEQLEYVAKHFQPFKGKLNQLSDVYMTILWPRAVGQPESYVLWDRYTRPTTYRQNAGLDGDKDGKITKAEAAFKVYEKLVKGYRPGYCG